MNVARENYKNGNISRLIMAFLLSVRSWSVQRTQEEWALRQEDWFCNSPGALQAVSMIAFVSLKALARQLPIISLWHLHVCVRLSLEPRILIMYCRTFLPSYVGYYAAKVKSDSTGISGDWKLINYVHKKEKSMNYVW